MLIENNIYTLFFTIRYFFISLFFIILGSCTSVPPININIDEVGVTHLDVSEDKFENSGIIQASIDKLKSNIQDNSDEKLVADIMLMLQARLAHSQKNFDEAIDLWSQALDKSSGRLSYKAFYGLVLSVHLSNKEMDLDGLSKKILEISEEKKLSFLKENKIDELEKLKTYISSDELFKGIHLTQKDNQEVSYGGDTVVESESQETFVLDTEKDPYLKDGAELYCQQKIKKRESYWKEQEGKLDGFYKIYWKGIKSECDKKTDEAIKAFSYLLTKYVDDKSTHVSTKLALNSGLHLVNLYKLKGNRLLMSYTWSAIVKIYEMGAKAEELGLEPVNFELQRIDHYLWTARYLAIAHDYAGATKTVNKSLELIKNLKKLKLTKKDNKQANVFEAESYSVLASRILIEEKKYKEALSNVAAIRKISDLPTSWKERVDWNEALYTYLDGDYKGALSMIEKLLANPNYRSNEVRYLYWMYKVYTELENTDEASFYFNQLIDKYPFSFYSVYSVVDKKNSHLSEYFTYNNSLKSYYLDSSEYSLILDGKAKTLLRRHELVLLSTLGEYYDSTSGDFYSYFKKKYKLTSKSFEDYLFVAKLLMASGDYIHSISLITELVKFDKNFWKHHPEYIFVYYPRPYMETYTKEAARRGFNVSVPLAISRQESSFRTQVKSSAGAIGVMQMMPETGIKMYKKLYDKSVDDKTMEQMLKTEKINIELGTYYLYNLSKRYHNNLPAVFGGYNAGEYMIDAWLDYRYNKDVVTWIESLPFNETKEYIKNVWRNMMIYESIFAVQKLEPTIFDVEEF